MNNRAFNVKTVQVSGDQNYTWGVVESAHGKVKKYAEIEYHWRGNIWDRIIAEMKRLQMRPFMFHYLKGADIDPVAGIAQIRGNFPQHMLMDKYQFFWRTFFRCRAEEAPKLKVSGQLIKLPSIAGDLDSLSLFINGINIDEIMTQAEAV